MAHDDNQTAPRTRRFGCGSVLLILFLLLAGAAGVGWWMLRAEPEQWKQVNSLIAGLSEDERRERADALQNRFTNEMQGIASPDDLIVKPGTDVAAERNKIVDRTIVIPIADANIWLATNLQPLLEHHQGSLPAGVSAPRVWIEDQQLVLSAKVDWEGINGVISTALEGHMTDDGGLALRVAGVRAGKLPIPSGMVEKKLKSKLAGSSDPTIRDMANIFEGVTIDPAVIDKPNGRIYRLMDFKLFADRLVLNLRTEPAP